MIEEINNIAEQSAVLQVTGKLSDQSNLGMLWTTWSTLKRIKEAGLGPVPFC